MYFLNEAPIRSELHVTALTEQQSLSTPLKKTIIIHMERSIIMIAYFDIKAGPVKQLALKMFFSSEK